MIEVKQLSKYYGAKRALDNISFKVEAGEILGFLGPNGAGKTTTMNIITGYLSSNEGTVSVDGYEILKQPMKVKSRIGYLPEPPPLYLDMTVAEYLSFMYDLKKLKLDKEAHIGKICERVQIADVSGRLIRNLSKGYRQRVGLAQALLGDPPVLILDEPTVGLDPGQIVDIRNLIKDLGKEHTIILSSHILSEVQATCERIIIIAQGRLVADDTPDNLAGRLSDDHSLVARIAGPHGEVLRVLRRLPGMAGVKLLAMREDEAYDYKLEPAEGEDVRRALFAALAEKDWPLLGLRSNELTLEEIFLQLVSGDVILEPDTSEEDAAEADESAMTDAQRAARRSSKKRGGKPAGKRAARKGGKTADKADDPLDDVDAAMDAADDALDEADAAMDEADAAMDDADAAMDEADAAMDEADTALDDADTALDEADSTDDGADTKPTGRRRGKSKRKGGKRS